MYNGEGDLDFEGTYRPISVIGYIDRLESLVCSQIIHYLEKSWFHIPWPICVSQTTLYSNYSLHRVIDDWLENINVGEWRVHTFWTYLSVFDSIKHDILLKKLEMYGFQDVELTWFKKLSSQPSIACFVLTINIWISRYKNGMPQGSVLGPFSSY